jgi:hypothetical protein
VAAQAARPETERLEGHGGGSSNLLREGVEQVFDLDRFGARFAFGPRQKRKHRARKVRQPPGRGADASQGGLNLDREVSRVYAGSPEDLSSPPALLDRPREQVNRFDLSVLAIVSQALGARDDCFCVRRVPLEMNCLLGGHAMARL